MLRTGSLACVGAGLACAVAAAQTVTVSLDSPQNGQTIAAGSTVNWSISFTVSTGNNQGLALLVADLVQDSANPALLDIPRATAVPPVMANFSRPAGITNPNEGGQNGYLGVPRGPAGQRNLIQVGGAQNTFGVARPPGTGIAENAVVTGGIGQSGAVVLASGSFTAPDTSGTYVFRLQNVVANVVQQVNTPPAFSPVSEATVAGGGSSFSFTVQGGNPCPCPGDFNNDNTVGLQDLTLFLASFGGTPSNPCMDTNGDNLIGLPDLTAFLSNFGNTCP